jgi:hypothetical protein
MSRLGAIPDAGKPRVGPGSLTRQRSSSSSSSHIGPSSNAGELRRPAPSCGRAAIRRERQELPLSVAGWEAARHDARGVRHLGSSAWGVGQQARGRGASCPASWRGCAVGARRHSAGRRYLSGPGRGVGRGDDPPRPSSMPIDVGGVLIWSGDRGFGAIMLSLSPAPPATRVCTTMSTPSTPDSHDMRRTFNAFSSRSFW